ncbi:fimbrial protein [Lelliottia sp. WAP21]|uniref:fimbrial protein n=1 Tax=Lelliottia sp. WAP21 TaxID=2877426 RepID=UPI001E532190|nr:fimbrial protein [Lelliottia sp. WAP21]
MINGRGKWSVALFILMCSFFVAAGTPIEITGRLIIPDCKINNGNVVEFNWGDLRIQDFDNSNTVYFARNFDIPLGCPYILGTPKMVVSSAAIHDAQQGVIQTSKYNEGLVIFLRKKDGTEVLPLNVETDPTESLSGSGNDKVLTLNAGIGRLYDMQNLTAGAFTAAAHLQIWYD